MTLIDADDNLVKAPNLNLVNWYHFEINFHSIVVALFEIDCGK